MSRVDEITAQLGSFSPAELRELQAWLDAHEEQIWDRQFEADVAAGKWDALAEKALRDHHEGKSTHRWNTKRNTTPRLHSGKRLTR